MGLPDPTMAASDLGGAILKVDMGRMLTENFALAKFVVSGTAEPKNINNSLSDLKAGNLLNITGQNLQKTAIESFFGRITILETK